MDKLISYGLNEQDFELLLDSHIDLDLLAEMDRDEIHLYIGQLKNNPIVPENNHQVPLINEEEVKWEEDVEKVEAQHEEIKQVEESSPIYCQNRSSILLNAIHDDQKPMYTCEYCKGKRGHVPTQVYEKRKGQDI